MQDSYPYLCSVANNLSLLAYSVQYDKHLKSRSITEVGLNAELGRQPDFIWSLAIRFHDRHEGHCGSQASRLSEE